MKICTVRELALRYLDAERLGTRVKALSQKVALRLEREHAEVAEGVRDPVAEQSKLPIGSHLDAFMASRASRGNDLKVEKQVCKRIERITEGVRVRRLLDLDAVKIEQFFSRERIEGYPPRRRVAAYTAP